MSEKPKIGRVGWLDLTVENAETVRDFYQSVAGWEAQPVSMGEYDDFCMGPAGEEPVGGVCHARGENAGLPAVWLMYIVVEDIEASLQACADNGGRVVREIREMGSAKIAVIEDPSGAVCALYQV